MPPKNCGSGGAGPLNGAKEKPPSTGWKTPVPSPLSVSVPPSSSVSTWAMVVPAVDCAPDWLLGEVDCGEALGEDVALEPDPPPPPPQAATLRTASNHTRFFIT